MPSVIASFGELERRLRSALGEVDRAAARRPEIPALRAIRAQLDELQRATAGGEPPPRALRDKLDFGQLASLHLHASEPELARDLYEIASWVVYA